MADKNDSTPKPDDKTQGDAVEKSKGTGDKAKAKSDAPWTKAETENPRDPLLMQDADETQRQDQGPPSNTPEAAKAGAAKPDPAKHEAAKTTPSTKSAKPAPRKPEPAEPEKPAGRVVEKRSGFLPALLGGVLAAILGFVAARADLLDRFLPDTLQATDPTEQIATLRDEVSAHDSAISDLRADLDGLSIPDLASLETQVSDLSARVDPLGERLDTVTAELDRIAGRIGPLDERLTELEKQPMSQGVSESAIAAYERELETLQSSVADQRAEMEALVEQARRMETDARAKEDQAAAAAQMAANRTAVAQVRAALDSGRPYADQLQMLENNGISVPAPLSDAAQDGVATMAALQTDFPPAARNALAAVRAQGPDGSRSFGTFLQRQLGARSVAPREGNDPDAILSRAEAALTNGNLSRALDEIENLPDAAKPPLADWRAQAETRLEAIQAADDLAQSLNTN